MPGSEFANPGLRAFYGHTAGPGRHYRFTASASLRGYIENRGGRVVGASVMDAQEGAIDIAVKPKMLAAIENKHGLSMNQFWQENSGYGIDKLTQSEAGHLRRAASVDEIRDRLAKARHEGIERLGKEGIGSSLRSERGESAKRTEVSSALFNAAAAQPK